MCFAQNIKKSEFSKIFELSLLNSDLFVLCLLSELQSEIAFCVIVANVLYKLFQLFFVVRVLAVFDPIADHVA